MQRVGCQKHFFNTVNIWCDSCCVCCLCFRRNSQMLMSAVSTSSKLSWSHDETRRLRLRIEAASDSVLSATFSKGTEYECTVYSNFCTVYVFVIRHVTTACLLNFWDISFFYMMSFHKFWMMSLHEHASLHMKRAQLNLGTLQFRYILRTRWIAP